MLHAVILAGGLGTRLWPASRPSRPKHLLVFEPPKTLLQATLDRLDGLVPPKRTWIVTNQSQAAQIADSLPYFDIEHILVEPFSRNTAPSIGWAAIKLRQIDPDVVMVVLPADHIIKPAPAFREIILSAESIVHHLPQHLITIGIKPTYPATSYGYIQRGDAVKTTSSAYHVQRFCEKPDRDDAESFYESGEYYWNAGIFIWKAETILELLRRFAPQIGTKLDVIAKVIDTSKEKSVTEKSFQQMESRSIDYTVMEKAKNVIVLESTFDWNDVGTWTALDRLHAGQKDANGNLAVSSKIVAIDSTNCTVRCDNPDHLVALIGLQDVVVIHTADATLIVRKDKEESVRHIVKELNERTTKTSVAEGEKTM